MENLNKKEFRKEAKKKLSKISKLSLKPNYRVLRNLKFILSKIEFKNILLYCPMQNEVNISKIFRNLRKDKNIFVPFMQGISFKIVKYRLPLTKKKFGVKEPRDSRAFFSKIDIAVVPVVGVDGKLRRIGYGKGMYDRFFASLKYKPIIIFVQNVKVFTKENIADDYDIYANFYLTPSDIYIKRGTNVYRITNSRELRRNRCWSGLYNSKKN